MDERLVVYTNGTLPLGSADVINARDDAIDAADRAEDARDDAAASAAVGQAAYDIADELHGIQSRRDFATFHLADYLHPDDLTAALQGTPDAQDIHRVTAAVQQFHFEAISAWAGRAGQLQRVRLVYLDGCIRINDEMLGEDSADLLWNTGWQRRSSKLFFDFRNLYVKAEFPSSVGVRTSGFYAENGITYPVRKVVFRLMKKVVSAVWLGEAVGNMHIDSGRDPRTDPDGVHLCNLNDANFLATVNCGTSCGSGWVIESAFNSRFTGVTSQTGWNPTEFGDNAGLIPHSVTFSNAGAVVTASEPIFTSDHAGRWFSLDRAGPTQPGGGVRVAFWSIIASVDSPTQITLADVPDVDVSSYRGSFEAVRGTIDAGSNVLTLSAPISDIDLTGFRVTVVGTYSGSTSRGHILPATVLSHSGATLTLNLPASIAATDAAVVFNASVHLAATDLTILGNLSANDMVAYPRLWTEDGGYGSKCGVQAIISGVHIDMDSGTKLHGCTTSTGNNFGGNFANTIVTRAKGFRFNGTSTHGGHSPRFGKHMFVGNYVDVNWFGESNYYPSDTHTADLYLAPVQWTGAENDFRVFYGMVVGSFGGDGFSQQTLMRSNGQPLGRALRSFGSVRPSRILNGVRVPSYFDDVHIDGQLLGGVAQNSQTDETPGRLAKVGAFGAIGATNAPTTTTPDDLVVAGTWRVFNHASMPSMGAYILEHQPRTGGQAVQFATRLDPGFAMYFRVKYGETFDAWQRILQAQAVSTAFRPSGAVPGQTVLDTTLGRPIWWNGTAWVDATGTPA